MATRGLPLVNGVEALHEWPDADGEPDGALSLVIRRHVLCGVMCRTVRLWYTVPVAGDSMKDVWEVPNPTLKVKYQYARCFLGVCVCYHDVSDRA